MKDDHFRKLKKLLNFLFVVFSIVSCLLLTLFVLVQAKDLVFVEVLVINLITEETSACKFGFVDG